MSFVLGYETIRVLLYNNYNNWVHYTHDTVQTLQHAHTHPYEHTYTNQTEHPTNLERLVGDGNSAYHLMRIVA
jgi:hypothetical protein